MEQSATGPVKRVQIEAVVIRANGERDDLGVIADSAASWRFGFGRLLARRRIKRANRKAGAS